MEETGTSGIAPNRFKRHLAQRKSLARILPHFVRWLRWSGRWLRGLVLEPHQPAMFHSGLARTVQLHQCVKWNHGSETAAPPAPHQPTYAPDTPKYRQRARHGAAMKRYGHVRARRARMARYGLRAATEMRQQGQRCGSFGAAKAKPKSRQKFFGGGVAYRTPLRIRPHLPTLPPFIRVSPARDGSSRGLCCCMLWPLLRLSTTRAARSCSTAADVAV